MSKLKLPTDPVARRQALLEAMRRWGAVNTKPKVEVAPRSFERLHRVMNGQFDKQLQVAADPARRKAIFGTRRMGKTAILAPYFTQAALQCTDNEATLFIIGPTLEHAKALLWRPLENLSQKYDLGLQLKQDPARCLFPNGVVLYFRGAKDRDQLGVLRGFKTLKVAVDECQEIRDDILTEIEAACGPGLRDLDGEMIWSGTPGRVPVGKWYDITTGRLPHWSVHQWSLFDNPHLPDSAKDLDLIMQEEGLTPESPRFKREYMGLWVEDTDEMVYAWDLVMNGVSEVKLDPSTKWHYVMGVDFGFNDESAIVVGAFSFDADEYYEVDEFGASGLTISKLMDDHVMPRIRKYNPMRIVGDAQAKQLIAEINDRWGIGMQKADKMGKLAFIELMNSDMMRGRVKTPMHFDLVKERQMLVWDPAAKPTLIEHPRRPNNKCDAALYTYREAKHWIGREMKSTLSFNSDADREAHYLREYVKQRTTQKQPLADWANDDDFQF